MQLPGPGRGLPGEVADALCEIVVRWWSDEPAPLVVGQHPVRESLSSRRLAAGGRGADPRRAIVKSALPGGAVASSRETTDTVPRPHDGLLLFST